jgi:hypothetical protein
MVGVSAFTLGLLMLFSVEALIHHMKYEAPDGTFEYRGLVEAEDLDQARVKFKTYWDEKGKPDRIYYTPLHVTFTEIIT